MLLMGAKSLAWFAGRDFVIPDDVKTALLPALRHRIVLSPTAELEGMTTDDVLHDILEIRRGTAMTFRPGNNLLRAIASSRHFSILAFFWWPVVILLGRARRVGGGNAFSSVADSNMR